MVSFVKMSFVPCRQWPTLDWLLPFCLQLKWAQCYFFGLLVASKPFYLWRILLVFQRSCRYRHKVSSTYWRARTGARAVHDPEAHSGTLPTSSQVTKVKIPWQHPTRTRAECQIQDTTYVSAGSSVPCLLLRCLLVRCWIKFWTLSLLLILPSLQAWLKAPCWSHELPSCLFSKSLFPHKPEICFHSDGSLSTTGPTQINGSDQLSCCVSKVISVTRYQWLWGVIVTQSKVAETLLGGLQHELFSKNCWDIVFSWCYIFTDTKQWLK